MFAKLLKHEFKNVAGLMSILTLGSLAVGIGSGLILRYMGHVIEQPMINDSLEVLLGILFFFSFLAMFAFAIIGSIYLFVQFYKRKFTDQGYLTFTLPVRSWQIYLSSFLNILIWDTLLIVALAAAFVLVFLIGFMGTEIWEDFARTVPIHEFKEMFSELDFMSSFYSILSSLCGVMLIMNSVILGAVIAKKHKVLGAVGTYYGTSMLMSAMSAWVANMEYIPDPLLALERIQLVSSALSCVFALGGAVLCIWLMDKKLNLP